MKKLLILPATLITGFLTSCVPDLGSSGSGTCSGDVGLKIEVEIPHMNSMHVKQDVFNDFSDGGPLTAQWEWETNPLGLFADQNVWFPAWGAAYVSPNGSSQDLTHPQITSKYEDFPANDFLSESSKILLIEVFNEDNVCIGTFDYAVKANDMDNFAAGDIYKPIVDCYPVCIDGEDLTVVVNYRSEIEPRIWRDGLYEGGSKYEAIRFHRAKVLESWDYFLSDDENANYHFLQFPNLRHYNEVSKD